ELEQTNVKLERTNVEHEQTLYYQWVAQAVDARDKNRAARAEEFLDLCPHGLRGWEWHYLKRLPFATFPVLGHLEQIILRMAFSPDGGLLAVATIDGRVSVWDAQTGATVRSFQAHKEFVRGLAFSPDGRYLATGGSDDEVKLLDLRTGKFVSFPIGSREVLLALTFSPDGRRLAASDLERNIWVFDVDTRGKTRLESADRLAIHGLEFSADSQHLLTVSTEGAVTAWDVAAHSAEAVFDAQFPGVHVVTFSPDRRLIALGDEHGTVRGLRADPGPVAFRDLEAHAGPIQALAFGSGGDRLATVASADTSIRLWDMRTGQEALSADFVGDRWNALAFSPDGHLLAVGGGKGKVRILDGTPLDGPLNGGEVRTLVGHDHTVAWLAYSPKGERIASASSGGTVRVWDTRSGREQRLPAGDAPVTSVAFAPDGRRIAAASWDGTVRVWDADTGREVYAPLRAQAGPVYGVAFSRDGRALASAHHDGTVRVWDADTGRWRRTIPAHQNPTLGLASSPGGGGEFLVSAGGKDECARVWKWDTDSQDPVLTLKLKGPRG